MYASRRDILEVAAEELHLISAEEWEELLDLRLRGDACEESEDSALAASDLRAIGGQRDEAWPHPAETIDTLREILLEGDVSTGCKGTAGNFRLPAPADTADRTFLMEWPMVAEDRDFADLDVIAAIDREIASLPRSPLPQETDTLAQPDEQCLWIRSSSDDL